MESVPASQPHSSGSGAWVVPPGTTSTPAAEQREFLTDYSARDKPWDINRKHADDVAAVYACEGEFHRRAERIASCAEWLRFARVKGENGAEGLKLRNAFFCRVRHCPICQWRRSLMWQARFLQAAPALLAQYPTARFLLLTLTRQNCEIGQLGEVLTDMNAAWKRFIERKDFAPVLGWIRATEVTRDPHGWAHPHFHCLMMVPASWFGRHYVKQPRMVELWQEAMRVSYAPSVDVRPMKLKPGASVLESLPGVVAETLKYATKPDQLTADHDWLIEYTRQVHKRRFLATGGVLRDVLREEEETDHDLVMADQPAAQADDGSRLAFSCTNATRRYRRAPRLDQGPSTVAS